MRTLRRSTATPRSAVSPSASRLIGSIRSNRLLMYALIGGVASAIDVGLFVLLHEALGAPALVAHSVSIPVSALYSFGCNAFFNFGTTDRLARRAASFGVVVALGYLLGAGVIAATEALTPFGGTAGKLLSLPLVFAFQFVLNSRVSFRESAPAATAGEAA